MARGGRRGLEGPPRGQERHGPWQCWSAAVVCWETFCSLAGEAVIYFRRGVGDFSPLQQETGRGVERKLGVRRKDGRELLFYFFFKQQRRGEDVFLFFLIFFFRV